MSYSVRESEARYTQAQLVEIATSTPEMLSPNVALRPIVQDAILPTAAYVGGPSELAYLAQIADAYAAFNLAAPEFRQRPFVLLMEPKVRRALDTAGLKPEHILRTDFSAASFIVDEKVDGEIDATRARAIDEARAALARFEAMTKQIDSTLEKALGSTSATVEKAIEEYAKRLRSALKRKSQTEIDRIESARELVLPGRELQERTLNALYYVNKYGLQRFQAALMSIEICTGMLQVVEI